MSGTFCYIIDRNKKGGTQMASYNITVNNSHYIKQEDIDTFKKFIKDAVTDLEHAQVNRQRFLSNRYKVYVIIERIEPYKFDVTLNREHYEWSMK